MVPILLFLHNACNWDQPALQSLASGLPETIPINLAVTSLPVMLQTKVWMGVNLQQLIPRDNRGAKKRQRLLDNRAPNLHGIGSALMARLPKLKLIQPNTIITSEKSIIVNKLSISSSCERKERHKVHPSSQRKRE